MQYLLSHEELANLQADAAKGRKAINDQDLQKLCTLVADHVPVSEGWFKGKVWGCILTKKNQGGGWYCDDCPARTVCPYPNKRLSK